MSSVTFADVVHQSINFSSEIPEQKLVLELIDNPWVQRLRDVHQTANTRLVYMFSEHSRFGHSLGVAYMAVNLMNKLEIQYPEVIRPYKTAVAAAALLHDIGHLAPGSHIAYKIWFPDQPDTHERTATEIIQRDPSIAAILKNRDKGLTDKIVAILEESETVPPWTWQIISGGGWNVDRGNWCIVDSVFAGVSYGKYNIPALTDSIIITDDQQLALRENRLDTLMHFAVSRQAMYRQVYQHRALLAADTLHRSVVKRARDLGDSLGFADQTMKHVLNAQKPEELELHTIYEMRESWWKYHLSQWAKDPDAILADLADRIINRRLLKTVRVQGSKEALYAAALSAVKEAGFNPEYYLHTVSTVDVHAADSRQSLLVRMDSGEIKSIQDADPLIESMMRESKESQRSWLALPGEAKLRMGRAR